MNLSLIVAMSEDRVIGREGDLPWRLSADLRRFKRLTTGHHVILGRKTYESLGRALPERTFVVVTRQHPLEVHGGSSVPDLEAAVELVHEDEQPFVIGGAEIYEQLLPQVQTLYLTRVHATIVDGDTYFPELDLSSWELVETESGEADEKNDHAYSFEVYRRRMDEKARP